MSPDDIGLALESEKSDWNFSIVQSKKILNLQLDGDAAADAICRALPSATREHLKWFVRALGDFAWPGAILVLTDVLKRPGDYWDKLERAEAVARCGGQDGFRFLIEGLDASNRSDNNTFISNATGYMNALVKLDYRGAAPYVRAFLSRWGPSGWPAEAARAFLARHTA